MKWFSNLIRTGNPTAIGTMLAALAIATYLPSMRNGFVNLDDPHFVLLNVYVQRGLTWEGIKWAFSTWAMGFWHPVTWISLMLDRELFGPGAAGFHLTSLLIHAANTLLLFVVFRRLTGATWRSATVAALFALHPLHVESVAWVSERKDVLSTFFAILCLGAYTAYVEKKGEGRKEQGERSKGSVRHSEVSIQNWGPGVWYGLALSCFAFALMSKGMVVTLPLLLLLLDWWPLGRSAGAKAQGVDSAGGGGEISRRGWVPLLVEKVPFLALALVGGVITVLAQRAGGALQSNIHTSILTRCANALLSYIHYLVQTVWPMRLAAYYPFPRGFSIVAVGIAVVLVLGISILTIRAGRSRSYMAFGWGWYVVALLPAIGLLQAGGQAQADRYTYVPLTGIFTLLVWSAHDLTKNWRHQRTAGAITGAVVLGLCVAVTYRQIGFWKDSETLFRRALAVTHDNYLAHNSLGADLLVRQKTDEAIPHFREALRLAPDYASAHANLGAALSKKGQLDEAIANLNEAIRLKPNFVEAHCNLGSALGRAGRLDEGIVHLQIALRLKPDYKPARDNLSYALKLKAAEAAKSAPRPR